MNLGLNFGETINNYNTILRKAIELKLPMICVNPDIEVMRGKRKEICAGALALKYENLGGKVKYFGKPYKKIYQECFNRIGFHRINFHFIFSFNIL